MGEAEDIGNFLRRRFHANTGPFSETQTWSYPRVQGRLASLQANVQTETTPIMPRVQKVPPQHWMLRGGKRLLPHSLSWIVLKTTWLSLDLYEAKRQQLESVMRALEPHGAVEQSIGS